VRSLEAAEITGYNPVQIGVYDITKPFDRSPALKVELQNALNVPISGTIRVTTPPDLKLKTATLPFKDLIPGKRTLFEFPVAGGAMNAENRYPLKIAVDTPKGRSELAESISLALIKRGTPEIRADATSARITAGWEKLGAVPVSILAEGNYLPVKGALALLNWKPADGDAPSLLNGKGIAKVAAMYDDQYFYLLAQVLDGREEKGQRNHSRVSMMGEWFKMMDPPADMVYARGPALPSGMLQIAFDCIPADKQPQYYPPDSPYHRRVSFFDTDYEFSIYQTTDGKPEVWCNLAPGIRYDDFYPFTPKGDPRQDVVADARASITHDGEMRVWVYQVAIPLARLKDLNPKDGGTTRFNFLIQCVGHWSEGRSTCVLNRCTFHPLWIAHYSDDVEWGFVQ